jgi:type I restriction enzyme S subunit
VPAYVEATADDLVCGYHLAIVRPKDGVDGRYLKFYFEHPRVRYHFASRANGATRFGLAVSAIESAPIALPPLSVQRKISAVIAAAEQEIAALVRYRNTLLGEKKALMQQLLTGKRRVKVEASI